MPREMYFELVDKATRFPLPDTSVDAVTDLPDHASVIRFRHAIKVRCPNTLASVDAANLQVYASRAVYDDKDGKPLKVSASVDDLGKDEDRALIVVVPTQHLVPRIVAPAAESTVAESTAIPSTSVLNEPEKFAKECTSLTEWDINIVHEIPLIWRFMSSLGGCTSNGKIFWRLEDKQVASILVDGWFRESTVGNINMRANKKSILMGSPGIGKSTLLCVVAFYLVFKHKKKLVVYRRLPTVDQENCLLYLGYEDGKVVQFSVLSCEESEAKRIYKSLRGQHGVSNVWLLLDGFRYQDIPEGLRTFRLLATSQQVNLNFFQELDDAYCCLFSCWRKQDLFNLGKQLFRFEEDDMKERFYYSGGSVREFERPTAEEICIAILHAVRNANDAAIHLSSNSIVQSGLGHLDRFRRTFVKDTRAANAFISCDHW